MAYEIGKVDVWAVDVLNQPGTLARALEALRNAGAQLEFVIARRAAENTSRVFLAPIKGAKQKQAAADVGITLASGMHAFRIEGPDRPGLGADLTRAIANQGINLRGVSAAVVGRRSVTYLAFDSEQDMKVAVTIVKKLLKPKGKR